MPRQSGFRLAVASVWLRLAALSIIGLLFAEALYFGGSRIQGWTFYLSTPEVFFEVLVRLLFGALVGIALATVCTGLLAPFLWYFDAARERLIEWATRISVILVLFVDSRYALTSLIRWSNRGVRFTTALLVAHFLFFLVALCVPRLRSELLTSLDGFLGPRMTRGIALATVIVTVGLAGMEFVLSKPSHVVKAATSEPRPKSNIVLITFDALSAEDLSVYGYRLPTTPNIDAFARDATVFTNFYSTSTFTTPAISTMLTGGYPSETHIHQLQSHLSAENVDKSLPVIMHAAGYATGGFLSNPFAYYVANSPASGFDILPEPVFQKGGLQRIWDLTRPIHQNSGLGSRVTEYTDLETIWNAVNRIHGNLLAMRYRPDASFAQAAKVLQQLPDGFFLWIHVVTPHHPYLPDPVDQGRFLPVEEGQRYAEEREVQWRPTYALDQQSQVDRRRLLYDEFVLSADRAFGNFMSDLEKTGKSKTTMVIVSADHGESFEGGVFRHETPYLTKPIIHIPLVIRTPGQQHGHTVAFTADQTTLAPTILELAGVPKPDWMHGQSLATWLTRNDSGANEGLAFTQFLEKNSVFKPLHHGTVGVIDAHDEYVLDLDTGKGMLRPLDQAQLRDLDRTAENPARAATLRAAIYARFPELGHESK
jgi:arylsulfatase A-like enzyme